MIAAVVVTYNRKNELCINIRSLLHQEQDIDSIIIIDNHSIDKTEITIKNEFRDYWNKIDYHYLPENIGGAGGFETGVRIAFEKGYHYIWLMDDDGYPANSKTLFYLMDFIHKRKLENTPFFINSLVLCDDDKLSFSLLDGNDRLSDIENKAVDGEMINAVNPFNGTLISRELVKDIGFPNGLFFIKGDETDYMNRAKRSGAYVSTVLKSRYYHPEMPKQFIHFLGKKTLNNIEAPWKEYYRMRNYTYMYKHQNGIRHCWKICIKRCLKIFITKCSKIETVKMLIYGFMDGIKGKLGKTIKP